MKRFPILLLLCFSLMAFPCFGAYPTTTEHHKLYPYTSVMASPYSCDNTGVLDIAASIELIKANQSNKGTIYFPHGTYKLATNLTIPAGIRIEREAGAKISIATGVVLTYNGDLQETGESFFTLNGTAVVDFSSNTILKEIPLGTWPINSNTAFSSNTKVPSGCVFSIATGTTLTINGLEAGLYQIFTCTGTGKVILNGVEVVKLAWFGGDSTGVADSSAALNLAIYASRNGCKAPVVVGPGTFNLTAAPVLFYKGVTVRGQGQGTTIFTSTANAHLFNTGESLYSATSDGWIDTLTDCTIDISANANDIYAIKGDYSVNRNAFRRINFIGNTAKEQGGIWVYHTDPASGSNLLHNNLFQECSFFNIKSANGCIRMEGTDAARSVIEGLSSASAIVVTCNTSSIVNGDAVKFTGITQADWTALNDNIYAITKINATSFSLVGGPDASSWVAYDAATDGGKLFSTATDGLLQASNGNIYDRCYFTLYRTAIYQWGQDATIIGGTFNAPISPVLKAGGGTDFRIIIMGVGSRGLNITGAYFDQANAHVPILLNCMSSTSLTSLSSMSGIGIESRDQIADIAYNYEDLGTMLGYAATYVDPQTITVVGDVTSPFGAVAFNNQVKLRWKNSDGQWYNNTLAAVATYDGGTNKTTITIPATGCAFSESCTLFREPSLWRVPIGPGISTVKELGTARAEKLYLGPPALGNILEIDDGLKVTAPNGFLTIPGSSGGLYLKVAEADADITAAASITIATQVPSGAVILGCQLRVDSALATGETWNAAYATGATQSITTNAAVALSTRKSVFFNPTAVTPITSGLTDVAITKNGGGSFTAQGNIKALVYYYSFATMDAAP